MVSKGQVVGMTGTASRGYTAMYLAHMNSLTASRCHIKASHMKLTNSAMLLVSSYEPSTWLCSIRLDHGGSWVQIPSGARIFPSLHFS